MASAPISEIQAIDGRLAVSLVYDVIHDPAPVVEKRKVSLRSTSTGVVDHIVSFGTRAPSEEITSMALHPSNSEGEPVARATLSFADNDVLGTLTYGQHKITVIEQNTKRRSSTKTSQPAKVKRSGHYFEVGDLAWRVTDKYLHSHKGKSRGGDLELVDSNDNVLAVFLNQWRGSANTKELGQLALTSDALAGANLATNQDLITLTIMSALLVLIHVSYRDRDGAKAMLKGVFGGAALCAVM